MPESLHRLSDLRNALVALHRTLLDAERIAYERRHGRVRTNGAFFRLVTEHRSFAWLQILSAFLVRIDMVLDAKEAVSDAAVRALIRRARAMFQRPKTNTGFAGRFYRTLEKCPQVVLVFGEVSKLLHEETVN